MKYVKPEMKSYTEEELQEIICASATVCGECYGGYCSTR